MDSTTIAILSATAAVGGSFVGGLSTLAASWLTQREQFRAQTLVQEAVIRRTLYSDFIVEASKRFAEAWNHGADSPLVVAGLYSIVQQMRLTAPADVVRIAEQVVNRVVEAYAEPDKTFDEFQRRMKDEDEDIIHPLSEFSEACRADLHALRR